MSADVNLLNIFFYKIFLSSLFFLNKIFAVYQRTMDMEKIAVSSNCYCVELKKNYFKIANARLLT